MLVTAAGKEIQRLTTFAVLAKNPSLFPAPTLGSLQLPITPPPWEPTHLAMMSNQIYVRVGLNSTIHSKC